MTASAKLVTSQYRIHLADQFIESLTEASNTVYYAFFGNHIEYADVSSIPQPNDAVAIVDIETYRDMIFGKRLTSNDVSLMILRNDYVTDQVYDMYDDQVGVSNVALFSSNFYATVNAGAYYHTFKCLNNNGGANSTVEPNFADINVGAGSSVSDRVYETSDGYVWKYMYTVDSAVVLKFATSTYFPLVPNTFVATEAISGSIDVVKVESPGRNYNNYTNGTFTVNDLRLNGSPTLYSINQSLGASTVDDFYTGCYLSIVSGTGVGQSRLVTGYTVNASFKSVSVDSGFSTAPESDSVYEIAPGVLVSGDGTQSSNAYGRAIINSISNTVQSVEMIEVGADYNFATAAVLASGVVGVTVDAVLRPIILPHGGHGADASGELGATFIGITVKISNTDVDIALTNDYRTVGILRDPIFAQTTISFTGANGVLLAGEPIYKVTPLLINLNADVETGSVNVTCDDADFTNQLSIGDLVYLKGANQNQVTTVDSVVNSSFITIADVGLFSCSAANVYLSNVPTYVTSVSTDTFQLTGNVTINTTSNVMIGNGTLFTNELIAGGSTIFVYSNSSGSGEIHQVTSITDDVTAALDSVGSYANTQAKAQRIDTLFSDKTVPGTTSITGWVQSVTLSTAVISNLASVISSGDLLVGGETGAKVVVASVARQGVVKGFDTFRQTFKYTISPVSGTFVQDEIVFQNDASTANALVHSLVGADLHVTNQTGNFNVANNIVGSNSGAIALVTAKYVPELVFGSGRVMYLEKIDAITRTNTTSDTIKLVLKF